jgi:hypothetical protein
LEDFKELESRAVIGKMTIVGQASDSAIASELGLFHRIDLAGIFVCMFHDSGAVEDQGDESLPKIRRSPSALRKDKRGYLLFSRFHRNDEELLGMRMTEKVKALGKMWVAVGEAEKAKWNSAAGPPRRRWCVGIWLGDTLGFIADIQIRCASMSGVSLSKS